MGRAFLTLCLVSFLNGIFTGPFVSLFPVYVDVDLGRIPFFTGYLRSLTLVLGGIFALVGGRLCDLLGLTHGVPQVVTPVAMEGMGLVEDEHVLVGRTPQAFADAVARLYEDEDLWTRLSDAGLGQVRQCNSLDLGLRQWRELLLELGCPVSP